MGMPEFELITQFCPATLSKRNPSRNTLPTTHSKADITIRYNRIIESKRLGMEIERRPPLEQNLEKYIIYIKNRVLRASNPQCTFVSLHAPDHTARAWHSTPALYFSRFKILDS